MVCLVNPLHSERSVAGMYKHLHTNSSGPLAARRMLRIHYDMKEFGAACQCSVNRTSRRELPRG